ncbi:uncharacterized protein G2W53_030879 [Senna tora]|uniref:Uncharacterized protein n=1 Tax=Senna tora TaxID=362788 RepID=A0A834T7W4_9FABA|nr:uncharacterized protein G2W53_030879 [Senna tora]
MPHIRLDIHMIRYHFARGVVCGHLRRIAKRIWRLGSRDMAPATIVYCGTKLFSALGRGNLALLYIRCESKLYSG